MQKAECFFWYRPTRVVPEQRPSNGGSSSSYKWSKSYTQTCHQNFEKLLKFSLILEKIVAPPNNLVQNDADRFKLCFFIKKAPNPVKIDH